MTPVQQLAEMHQVRDQIARCFAYLQIAARGAQTVGAEQAVLDIDRAMSTVKADLKAIDRDIARAEGAQP